MTLLELIREIEDVAAMQPSVSMIVENDVLRLNSYADARYGAFVWTQGRHRANIGEDFTRYAFTFFYIDRLRNDIANQVEVQSVGMETLQNVLRTLWERGIEPESQEFQPFNQRFADECAGVYCSVILVAQNGASCAETADGGMLGPDGWERDAEDVLIRIF